MAMKKLLSVLVGVLGAAGLAWGVEDHQTLQLVARIQPRVALSLDQSQLTFAGSEDQALIPAQEGAVQVTARGRAGASRPLTLTMQAASDLEGAAGSIPIQQVSWLARGGAAATGFLSRTEPQLIGRWAAGGVYTAQLQFSLRNNGSFLPGDYAAAVNFTLSSP